MIAREIPILLDYLVLQVESGHTVQQSLQTSSRLFLNSDFLFKPLKEIDNSIQAGSTLAEALVNFRISLNTPVADASIQALLHTIRNGTPAGKALREQSTRLREELILTGEHFANTVSIKILIPLLFFIFPSSFLVIFSPVIVSLIGRLP
jgi:tight adherence protein C